MAGGTKLMPPDIRQIAMLLITNMLENFGELGELLERLNLSGHCAGVFTKGFQDDCEKLKQELSILIPNSLPNAPSGVKFCVYFL